MESGVKDKRNPNSVRESYDRLADEYARRIFNELTNKPIDRELLDRFASDIGEHGEVLTWVAALVTLRAICTSLV